MESFRRAAGRCCGLVLIDLTQPTDTSISHSTQWDRNYCSTPLDHQLMRRGIFLCEGFSRNAALKMREWGTMNGEILERKAAPGIEGFLSRGRHCWTMASKVFCGQKKLLPAFLTNLDFSSIRNKKSKVRSAFDRHKQVIESEHLTCFDCSLRMGRLTQQVVFVKHLRSEDTNQCRKSQ